MAYNVFESTNMHSVGRNGGNIFDAVATVDVENGTFGYLNGLDEDGGVVYKFVPGTKEGLKIGDVFVADQPAWTEDESKITNQRKDNFIIKAGTVFRVREVYKNDKFATAIEGFTTATQSVVTGVDNFTTTNVYASIDATTGKLVAATTKPDSGVIIGRIESKRQSGATLVTTARTYGYQKNLYKVKIVDVDVTE